MSTFRMGTRSSGTGDLELVTLAGEPPYKGSNAVSYSIQTPLGAFETGYADYTGRFLMGRAVVTSSSSNNLISVPVPPAGVVVTLTARVAEEASGAFTDGDYGGIVVSSGGTIVVLGEASVTAEAIPVGEIPADRIEGGELKSLVELKTDLSLPTDADHVVLIWHRSGIANGTYAVHLKAQFPFMVTAMAHSGSESLTVTAKNGTTNITGLATVAVTTATAQATATAANTFAIGDALNVTVADIATTGDVRLEFLCTRT